MDGGADDGDLVVTGVGGERLVQPDDHRRGLDGAQLAVADRQPDQVGADLGVGVADRVLGEVAAHRGGAVTEVKGVGERVPLGVAAGDGRLHGEGRRAGGWRPSVRLASGAVLPAPVTLISTSLVAAAPAALVAVTTAR